MDGLSEDNVITAYFAPLSGEGSFNLQDDVALLNVPADKELVMTVDTVTSGVDFFEDAEPEEVAAKALRVNLSDIAAKGAEPMGYLLALSLPETDAEWLKGFSQQLAKDQRTYNLSLLGGDTTRASLLSVTVTAYGTLPKGKMVRRVGAKPGDIVAVTGTIGDAALGLQVLRGKIREKGNAHLVQRYRMPQPPVGLALLLREYASASMDISDGFVGDLQKLCKASDVSARIALENVPHSSEGHTLILSDEIWRETALTGGDDYETLFTIAPENWDMFTAKSAELGIQVAKLGEIIEGPAVPLFTLKKEPRSFVRGSYRHF